MWRQVVRSTVIRGVRLLAVASAAALAAALALVPSLATAGSAKPSASASEEATHPDTHGVMQGQAHYTVNRGAQQIRSQTCTLTAEGGVPLTIPCATAADPSSTKSASSYTLPLTLSAAGSYTFAVNLALTDGGRVGAKTTFSTNSAENVCTSFTGWDFADHGGGPHEPYWICGGMYQPDMLDTVYSAVLPYCVNPAMGTLNTGVNQEVFCG